MAAVTEKTPKPSLDMGRDAFVDGRVDEEKDTESVKSLGDYGAGNNDPFGDEEFAEVKYKVMSWW